MRTLVGAAEPPRRPADGFTFATGTTSVADAVIITLSQLGHNLDAWQRDTVRRMYREPLRVSAIVGRPLPPGTPAIMGEIV